MESSCGECASMDYLIYTWDTYFLNSKKGSTSVWLNCKELGFDRLKLNVNRGAIALGHPIGASGTRILVTLLNEMQPRHARHGLATLCIGGGQGVAMIVER